MTSTSPISSSNSEPASTEPLAERLHAVRAGVAEAARRAGRDVGTITTIAVTKFQPVSMISALLDLGVRDFGESRHQEAQEKAAQLRGDTLTWHFVGQIQGKKARQIRAYAHVLHSVDRESLVRALSTASPDAVDMPAQDCFIQLNLTQDPTRGGVDPSGLDALVDQVLASPGLRLLGLMAVAPREGEPRRAFAQVRELSERMQRTAPTATALSIGMSEDYAGAILEGATHLRIGTAITGIRPTPG
ncbi:MAG: YggS family pyridoxal phosphate-dependent enzyme [Cryobacterium sp.]